MKKIILMRHSEVDIDYSNKISPYDFKNWVVKYNNSDIKSNISKKDSIEKVLEESNIILCSNLKRSIDSVKQFDKNIFGTNDLFNEFEIPFFKSKLLKLNPKVWLVFFRFLWFFGYSNGCESFRESRLRVEKAVDRLVDLSTEYDSITLVGSGLINRFIGKELIKRNWINSRKLKNKNLDYGVYEC